MKRVLRDNSLSLVLLVLFVLFLAGQAIAGWLHYNEEQQEHQQAAISFLEYLTTGAFGESVFRELGKRVSPDELICRFDVFLFQRGSAESKDPDKKEAVDEDPVT